MTSLSSMSNCPSHQDVELPPVSSVYQAGVSIAGVPTCPCCGAIVHVPDYPRSPTKTSDESAAHPEWGKHG